MGDFIKDNRTEIRIAATHDPTDADRNSGVQEEKLDWLPHVIGAADWVETEEKPTTSGVTVTLSSYTTVEALLLKASKDNGADVEVEWYQQKGQRAAGNLAITSAAPDTLEDQDDEDWATTPTWLEEGDYVHISAAAEDAGNQNTYHLVQSIQNKDATNDEVTLAQDTTTTANADDDTAVVTSLRKNKIILAPGETVALLGNSLIWPAKGLVMTARSGTQTVKTVVVKT